MNGLGNEIVVVDLRGSRRVLERGRGARHRRASGLALRPDDGAARSEGRRAPRPTCASTIPTARRPRRAATACAASAGWWRSETGRKALKFETRAGVLDVAVARHRPHHRRHGHRRGSAGTTSRLPRRSTTRAPSSCRSGRSTSRSCIRPSVVNVGNPHAVFWVDDVDAYDLGRIGPMLENHPIFPERANISLAHVTSPDRHHAAHLGARRRPDQGLRQRRLRGNRVRGAQGADRAAP